VADTKRERKREREEKVDEVFSRTERERVRALARLARASGTTIM